MKTPLILVLNNPHDGLMYRAIRANGLSMDFDRLEDAKQWAGTKPGASIAGAACSTHRRWAPAFQQYFTEVMFLLNGSPQRFHTSTTN